MKNKKSVLNRKGKTMRRMQALLLAIVMVLGVMSTTALAEQDPVFQSTPTDIEAIVGTTPKVSITLDTSLIYTDGKVMLEKPDPDGSITVMECLVSEWTGGFTLPTCNTPGTVQTFFWYIHTKSTG